MTAVRSILLGIRIGFWPGVVSGLGLSMLERVSVPAAQVCAGATIWLAVFMGVMVVALDEVTAWE